MFLPSANEVCEGYVFTSVCLSTEGEGAWPGGCAWQWGMCGRGWGRTWHACPPPDTTRYGQ